MSEGALLALGEQATLQSSSDLSNFRPICGEASRFLISAFGALVIR